MAYNKLHIVYLFTGAIFKARYFYAFNVTQYGLACPAYKCSQFNLLKDISNIMANILYKLLANFIQVKKTALILLSALYMLSVAGIAVNKFYCCGKLKSISFSWNPTEKSKHKNGLPHDGCCKNIHEYLKIIDTHSPSNATFFCEKVFSIIYVESPFLNLNPAQVQQAIATNNINSPPLLAEMPIYIFNCTYLI